MGREARPACLPCGSKPISDKSQGAWGTASPNLIPSIHLRSHSLIYPETLAINYRAHAQKCVGRVPGNRFCDCSLSEYRNKLAKMPNPINQRHRGGSRYAYAGC